jgi:hypothetical protein
MLTTLLLMQLCAGDVSESREETRLRASAQFALAAGLSGPALGFGPGGSLEIGAVFADRFSVVLRTTMGISVIANLLMAGLGFDFAISDRFSLGVTPSIALVGSLAIDLPSAAAAFAQMRLTFAPFGRGEGEVQRKGLSIFAEAGPGIALGVSSSPIPGGTPSSRVSFAGAIGVGYSVW